MAIIPSSRPTAQEFTILVEPDFAYSFGSSWLAPFEEPLEDQNTHLWWDTDTAIAAVLDHKEKFDPEWKARAERQAIRELIERMSGGGPAISQKRFWDFYTATVGQKKSQWLVDGQHRLAISTNTYKPRNSNITVTWQNTLSARVRANILSALDDEFLLKDDFRLADLSAFLTNAIRACVTLTGRFHYKACERSIPSTAFWVHSHALWTGIAPPVLVTTNVLPFTKSRTGNKNAPYYRPNSACYRRGYLDRRASLCDGQSRPSFRSSSARRPNFGRHQRLFRSHLERQWLLHDPGGRQVGDRLRYVQHRT
jgi:hypothetical protein